MCGGYSSVCQAYWSADAVFVGSVQRVEQPPPTKDEDGEEHVSGQVVHIQVEKAFKGMRWRTQVVFRTRGTSCDATYEEGERWLFYAHYDKKTKQWGTHSCGRSSPVEYAADDLLYLQGLPASARKTRIAGELTHYEEDPVEGFKRVKNIIGARVRVKGEKRTYEVYTDRNGVYEIYGLPPGKYTVEAEPLPGLKASVPHLYGERDTTGKRTLKLVLREKSCAGADFSYKPSASITGTLFGADGRPLSNVSLKLAPKDRAGASDMWKYDRTDKQGRYELEEIPPGEYFIVVNYRGQVSGEEPFPTTYYPGVFERHRATVVTVTSGDRLENYDIHIPTQLATRVLQGVLLYSDGLPAAEESVSFEPEIAQGGYEFRASAETDAEGRFSLTVLRGVGGSVHGSMLALEGEYADCPQLDKLIRAAGGDDTEVRTRPVRVEDGGDMQGIKLVFPFPRCEKAKPE